jgi:hypothetical protein
MKNFNIKYLNGNILIDEITDLTNKLMKGNIIDALLCKEMAEPLTCMFDQN